MNSSCSLEDENVDEQFLSISRNTCTQPKQCKPKFSIMDDFDELNEMINGPGANQDNSQMKSVLEKAFKFGSTDKDDKSNNINPDFNEQNQEQSEKQCRKSRQNDNKVENDEIRNRNWKKDKTNKTFEVEDLSEDKENSLSYMNQYQFKQNSQKIKDIKVPRIAIRTTQINLLNAPATQDFYLTGLENIEHLLLNNELIGKVPRNSFKENQDDCQLFGRALNTQKYGSHKYVKNDLVPLKNR